MIGISWGGFAALQIAARRPPQLKAIVKPCVPPMIDMRGRALDGGMPSNI
ncbi:MAG: hypothetical protein Ct9H300mP19_20590 [Dehalococcoidia bacterium]|nr:MAG: hypothetical protein Ct9H300mP19_20590 [Dehalococcoidia bacterium]